MFDISAMIQTISDMIKSFFDFSKSKIENATTSEVLIDKHKQEKAIYHAEKAIEIMLNYISLLPKTKQLKLKHHINSFNKYD